MIQGGVLTTLVPILESGIAAEDPMKTRIANIIQDYSSQGIHRTGTQVDHVSADWLVAKIESLGIKATESSFLFDRVQVREASFSFAGLKVAGIPLFDCHYTDADGISGSIGKVGSEADIGVIMSLPFSSSPSGLAVHSARQANKHKAIVVVTDDRLPADGIATLNAEDFRKPFGPPVLQVASQNWADIQAAISSRLNGLAVIHCDYVSANARNIGAVIKGKQSVLDPLVIMTPRSGWWRCASERGGGLACFLEMRLAIKEKGANRDVIFTANTGHELGHIGLDQYLEDNRSLIGDASLWVHLGANFAARYAPGIRLQYSDESVRETLAPFLKTNFLEPASETDPGSRPLGEARNIHDGGGRYVSILGQNGLFHHPSDVWPDAVDLDVTVSWIRAFVQMGVELSA
jgi:hypothetical protein